MAQYPLSSTPFRWYFLQLSRIRSNAEIIFRIRYVLRRLPSHFVKNVGLFNGSLVFAAASSTIPRIMLFLAWAIRSCEAYRSQLPEKETEWGAWNVH